VEWVPLCNAMQADVSVLFQMAKKNPAKILSSVKHTYSSTYIRMCVYEHLIIRDRRLRAIVCFRQYVRTCTAVSSLVGRCAAVVPKRTCNYYVAW
jgi:hypothetical protein